MSGTPFICNSNGLEIDNMSEVQSASNLKNLARKANLSGVEIAKQMGFRPETVSRHLNGRQNKPKKQAGHVPCLFYMWSVNSTQTGV